MSKIGTTEQWQYTYNADGMRTQRTNGTTTYQYTYLGGQLTHMTVAGHTMYFAYDAAGVPLSMTYDGVNYYYVTNLQGDVVAILNNSGTEVVSYAYDAWGNLITAIPEGTLGFYNPLRYRGYVYDTETELYYLQSRYYDPEMGRFINADGFASTGQGVLGNNMFAYCNNNPVNGCDPNGELPLLALIGVGAVVGVGVLLNKIKNKKIDDNGELTPTEKALAKKHPIAAYKANKAREIADQYTQERYGDNWKKGANEANAFRHAMWNAVMTDKIGAKKAKKFADAHEAEHLTDQPEYCIMDLYNNQLGRSIALAYPYRSYNVYAQKIQEAVDGGQAYVIQWSE